MHISGLSATVAAGQLPHRCTYPKPSCRPRMCDASNVDIETEDPKHPSSKLPDKAFQPAADALDRLIAGEAKKLRGKITTTDAV